MSNHKKFDEEDVQTLFHMIEPSKELNMDIKRIHKLTFQVFDEFLELIAYPLVKDTFNKYCREYYKQSFDEVFEDMDVDFLPLPPYEEDEAKWIEFLTMVGIMIVRNVDDLPSDVKKLTKSIMTSIGLLNKPLRLRLDLYEI